MYKGLKNYVVKVENITISERKKYIKYLESDKSKSHTNTKIININNKSEKDLELKLMELIHKNNVDYVANGKGGQKLKNIFKSITFNIPPDYNATEQQLISISKNLEKEIIEYYKLKNIEYDKESFFNIAHYQDNPHTHLLIPTIDKNGKNNRLLKNKSFLTLLKGIFIKIVDKELEKNIKDYKVEVVPHITKENTQTTITKTKAEYIEKYETIKEQNEIKMEQKTKTKLEMFLDIELKRLQKEPNEKLEQYLKNFFTYQNRTNNALKEQNEILETIEKEMIENKVEIENIEKIPSFKTLLEKLMEINRKYEKNKEYSLKAFNDFYHTKSGKGYLLNENDFINNAIYEKHLKNKKILLAIKSNKKIQGMIK